MLDRIDEDDNEHDEDPDAADDIVITFTYRSSCCGKACRLIHLLALPFQVVQPFPKNPLVEWLPYLSKQTDVRSCGLRFPPLGEPVVDEAV